MICQSASSSWSHADVLGVEVGVGPDELGQRRHAGQPRRAAHPAARTARRSRQWQDGGHGVGVLGPGRGRGPQGPRRPVPGRPDRRADHDARRSADPHLRDGIAYPTLATWVSEGVYDDLLEGLGDGMTAGLAVGIGEDGTDTVFRRSFSALVLAECIERATTPSTSRASPDDTVLRWGDRIAGWLVRERDLRGFVPGKGWAHARRARRRRARRARRGAGDGPARADRAARRDRRPAAAPTRARLVHGEDDRLAAATMQILRRDLVGLDVLEPWVARLAGARRARPPRATTTRTSSPATCSPTCARCTSRWRWRRGPPACRADLLLVLIDAAASRRTRTSCLSPAPAVRIAWR